ncbi:MAG: hypothetical protein ACOX3G_05580 [Armatimonadota bacterium]
MTRPIISITVGGRDPGRPEPELPSHHFTAFYDLSIPAEAIVDRWDYDLSCISFYGCAIPHVWPNFGPGVAAAFMGAEMQSSTSAGTVWFHPAQERPISEIHFEYQPDNIWFRRIADIYLAAAEKWRGLVQVGMTDLGGNLDLLSTFRPAEQLLYDLYDHPNEVKRLTWEAHELWWRYFTELDSIIRPVNPGYSAWSGFYSQEPHYMLQCDFCYMISPQMFDEFVRPEIAASCKRMPNGFYHLDGPGQLPHLESLLSIPELKGIQWVPGAGQPDPRSWPQVYKKIQSAGKLSQLYGPPDTFEALSNEMDSLRDMLLMTGCATHQEAVSLLKKYGAD